MIVSQVSLSARRAWIEMSGHRQAHTSPTRSLSARRAWIEIWLFGLLCAFVSVALRKESVDRNNSAFFIMYASVWSLSARRAWIEIVAYSWLFVWIASRSPQGERG